MKTFVYLLAMLVGVAGFAACTDDPADNITPQVTVPEVTAPDSEDVEENMEEEP